MTTHPAYQKLAQTAHTNAEQFQAWASIALDASEKLLAINFGAARSLCETASATPLTARDVQQTLAQQAAANSRNLEQLGDYLRRVNEVCVEAQSEFVELGSRQFEQLQQAMTELLEEARTLNLANPLEAALESESRSRSLRKAA